MKLQFEVDGGKSYCVTVTDCNSLVIRDMIAVIRPNTDIDNNQLITIPIPAAYSDALPDYITHLTTVDNAAADSNVTTDATTITATATTNTISTVSLLRRNFELADWLDDLVYFNSLLKQLFDNWSVLSEFFNEALASTLRYRILLACPRDLLPQQFVSDPYFMAEWLAAGYRTVKINNCDIYHINKTLRLPYHETAIINCCTKPVVDDGDLKLAQVGVRHRYIGRMYIVLYYSAAEEQPSQQPQQPQQPQIKAQLSVNIADNHLGQQLTDMLIARMIITLSRAHGYRSCPSRLAFNQTSNQQPMVDVSNQLASLLSSTYTGVDASGTIASSDSSDVVDEWVNHSDPADDVRLSGYLEPSSNFWDSVIYNDDLLPNNCSNGIQEIYKTQLCYPNNPAITNHGCWYSWYPNGQLHSVHHFNYGQRCGRWLGYRNIDQKDSYQRSAGLTTSNQSSTNQPSINHLLYDIAFNQQGRRDGTWCWYYEDGKQAAACYHYRDGLRVGDWQTFNKDGELTVCHRYNQLGQSQHIDPYTSTNTSTSTSTSTNINPYTSTITSSNVSIYLLPVVVTVVVGLINSYDWLLQWFTRS